MIEWIDDSDLPKLQSIILGVYTLSSDYRDDRDDRKTTRRGSYYFKSTLTMISDSE